jgi:UDP-glucose:(glucosyl)LPS alpha-1,2-glucosyltransferase
MLENVDVKIPQHEEGSLAENSLGGTELVTMELFRRLPDEYKEKFQFVVSRVNKLDENKPKLYWLHDLALDPAHSLLTQPGGINLFEKLIFVSHWQMQQFNTHLKIPYSKGVVLKNAIDPIEKHQKRHDGKLNLIYASTPQRGLDVLLYALDMLERDDWHLDVYSSFKLYGWEANDEPYKPLFEKIKEHPNMTYHGTQPYETVREAYKNAHILTYPSTWQETSCRVAMEAMSAGCAVVTSNWGALPETCGEFAYMYQYSEDKVEHAERFADALENVMDDYDSESMKKNLDLQVEYSHTNYSWDKRIGQWTDFLDNLIYEIDNGSKEEGS